MNRELLSILLVSFVSGCSGGSIVEVGKADAPAQGLTGGNRSPRTLADHQPRPQSVTSDGQTVYWSNSGDGGLYAIDVGGGAPRLLSRGPALWYLNATSSAVLGAVMPRAGFADITSVALDGSARTVLAAHQPVGGLERIGLKVVGSTAYWNDDSGGGEGTIWNVGAGGGRANATLSILGPAYANPPNSDEPEDQETVWPSAFDVDSDGNVVWTDIAHKAIFLRRAGDMNASTITYTQYGDWISFDSDNIYWHDYKTIYRVSIFGDGTRIPLTQQADAVYGPQSFVRIASRIYWISNAGEIQSVSTSGGSVTTLATGQDHPSALAADANNLYWTNAGSTGQNGSVMSLPL